MSIEWKLELNQLALLPWVHVQWFISKITSDKQTSVKNNTHDPTFIRWIWTIDDLRCKWSFDLAAWMKAHYVPFQYFIDDSDLWVILILYYDLISEWKRFFIVSRQVHENIERINVNVLISNSLISCSNGRFSLVSSWVSCNNVHVTGIIWHFSFISLHQNNLQG